MTVSSVSDSKVSQVETLILEHPCASHKWFELMTQSKIEPDKLLSLLINYDAHATLLRRLLLKSATIMPEAAVGFILENVRTEYGSGDYSKAHQLQLFDLINKLSSMFEVELSPVVRELKPGVRQYLEEISTFYFPEQELNESMDLPSIAAGAITATEVLAMKEFVVMQKAFSHYGLDDHIWFNHVEVEQEHAGDSLNLVEYFLNSDTRTFESIEFGIGGVLMCNTSLYDGFQETLNKTESTI